MTCPGAAKFRTRVLDPGRIRSGSDLVLQRVAERLHPDEAVTEHEGVDAVLDPGLGGVRGPFQEQDVALVDQRLQIPRRVRDVGEQSGERRPDALLAAQDA